MKFTIDIRKLTKEQRLEIYNLIINSGYTIDFETTKMLVENTSSRWNYLIYEKNRHCEDFISYSVLTDSTIELSFESYIKRFNSLKFSRDFKYYAVKCNNIDEMNFVYRNLGYGTISMFNKYATTDDGCSNEELSTHTVIDLKDWVIKINENYEV